LVAVCLQFPWLRRGLENLRTLPGRAAAFLKFRWLRRGLENLRTLPGRAAAFLKFRWLRALWLFLSGSPTWLWLGRLLVAALPCALALLFAGYLAYRWRGDDPATRVLFVERTVTLQTGYSVLLPLTLLAAGVLGWAYFTSGRLDILHSFKFDCPYPNKP